MKELTGVLVFVSLLGAISAPAFAQSNPAAGCSFICETFEPESNAVRDAATGNVLYDGTYLAKFETDPLVFYFLPGSQFFTLGSTTSWNSSIVQWGRFLSPGVNNGVSYLMFPSGTAVTLAYVRVRSAGGGDWTIQPVDRNQSSTGSNVVISGGNYPPLSRFICSDQPFSGLAFHVRDEPGSAEPEVYEVCIPQDPSLCIAEAE
jgi:hypothetical protein